MELVTQRDMIEFTIRGWLHEKRGRTDSERTEREYARALASYRRWLSVAGTDLDGLTDEHSLMLQAWAGYGRVSAPAFNRQVSAISSFYEYCIRHRLLNITVNPAIRVKRRPVQSYQKSRPQSFVSLSKSLRRINRETVDGKRDYALLVIAALTGRRVSELARLSWEDIEFTDEGVTLTWNRTKGGKTMRDSLPQSVGTLLREYHWLLASSGCMAIALRATTSTPQTPVWVSLARNGTMYRRLSVKALEAISSRRLGTSKFHQLRHAFAHQMESSGAPVSHIQRQLGHSSLDTTGRYLDAMRSDENRYLPALTAVLGIV